MILFPIIICFLGWKLETPPRAEIPALIEQLGNNDFGVRDKAHKELVNLGEQAVPWLVKALRRPEKDIRISVFLCLGEIARVSRLAGKSPIGKEAISDLIEMLKKEPSPDVRGLATRALVVIGPPKPAIPHLIQALEKDPSPEVRRLATWALVEIGPPKAAIPHLIQALEKDAMSEAASALEKIGREAKAAVPALIRAAKKKGEKHYELRLEAIKALTSIQDSLDKVVPLLCESLDDVWDIKKTSYESLVSLGPKAKSAIPFLIKKIKGKQDIYLTGRELPSAGMDLRVEAAYTLAKIDPSFNQMAISAIIEFGKDKEAFFTTRCMACEYLGELGIRSGPVFAFLNAALKDEEISVRGYAETALKKLHKERKKGQVHFWSFFI